MIFLFNVGGYYIVFWALRYQSNLELSSRLDDNDYSHEETVELKIPINMPYPIHPRGFERAHGEFEHKGEFYQLVKQKFLNDTLYIVCYKDYHEKNLVETMKDYATLSNDLPGTAKKALTFIGKLLKEYQSETNLKLIETSSWCQHLTYSEQSGNVLVNPLALHSPPPKG
jgi:hypothetical protein